MLVSRATESNVIDMLVTRKLVTVRQNEAALRLKIDYHRAHLAPHLTGSYRPSVGTRDPYRAPERNDDEEAAYQRWHRAVAHLVAGLSGIVISTAYHDIQPPPSRLPHLKMALEKLADWYGLN